MLNLLIAFINDSYASTVAKKHSAFIYSLTVLLKGYDNAMSSRDKRAWHNKLNRMYLYIATPNKKNN